MFENMYPLRRRDRCYRWEGAGDVGRLGKDDHDKIVITVHGPTRWEQENTRFKKIML